MAARWIAMVAVFVFAALASVGSSSNVVADELHGFYHTWIPREEALGIVTEQMRTLRAHGLLDKLTRLHVSLFGERRRDTLELLDEALGRRGVVSRKSSSAAVVDNDTATGELTYDVQALGNKGVEFDTLDELWEHCVAHPTHWVFYTHSKGALHAAAYNDEQRIGQDRVVIGELHRGCLDMLGKGANVCGPRMSSRPHMHYSGNAWWAACSYVSQLERPSLEPRTIDCRLPEGFANGIEGARLVFASGEMAIPRLHCLPKYAVATERFHGEHWITSSPLVKPANCYDWPADSTSLSAGYTTAKMNCRFAPIESWQTWRKSPFEMGYVSRAAYDWERHLLHVTRGARMMPAAKAVVGFYGGTIQTAAALDVFKQQVALLRRGGGAAGGVASSIRYHVRGALAAQARAVVADSVAAKGNALVALWNHCKANADDAVFYFNDYADADVRAPSDATILGSTVCKTMLEHGATVCGAAVRGRPHIHVPGNSFWASCRYIAQLPSPKTKVPTLPCKMASGEPGVVLEFPTFTVAEYAVECVPDWCLGVGRYRQAHWIATHPGAVLSWCKASDCSFIIGKDLSASASLAPATRSMYDYCFAMRSAYDNERFVVGQTLGL